MDVDEQEVGYKWESSYAEGMFFIYEKFEFLFFSIAGLNIQEAFTEDDSGSVEKAIAKLVEDAKKRKREKERPAKKRIGVVS